MKKRNQKLCDLNQGAKVLCACFSDLSKNMAASGDDKNNVLIWRLPKTNPIATLSYSSLSAAQVEVSAISFNPSQTQIFSGSNRGIINVWDVNTQKQIFTLKGHIASVNSFACFPDDENLILSGAYDTLIKQWDLRTRNSIAQFKGHTMQINCLAVSPDSKILSSGAHDGLVKIWDIYQQKCIHSFIQHDSPVNCLQYNPVDKALATGANDRTVKYWDLDTMNIISSTRPDATPIQAICFEQNGKYVFSAANDSLKVWNLEKEGILLDNVESSWKNIFALTINGEEMNGLAMSSTGFGLFGVSLSQISTEPKPPQRSSTKGRTPEHRIQSTELPNPIRQKPNLAQQARNILSNDYGSNDYQSPNYQPSYQNQQQLYAQCSLSPPQENKQNQYQQPQSQQYQPQQYQPQQQQYNQPQQQSNQPQYIQPQQQQYNQPSQLYQNQPLYQNQAQPPQQYQYANGQVFQDQLEKQLSDQVIKRNFEEEEEMKVESNQVESSDLMISNNDLSLSGFLMGNEQQKEKFKQVDMINEITKEHVKVVQILKQRLNYMEPIVHWWKSGNLKPAINAIGQLSECSIILDSLMMCKNSQQFSQINLEWMVILLEKAKVLVESKYMSHIKGGLEFIRQGLNQVRDEVISIKQFSGLSKGDLQREDRIIKCDKVIEIMREIAQMPKLDKIIQRNKDDITPLAKQLQSDILIFLKKTNV